MREAIVSIGDGDFEALGIEELVKLMRSAGIRDFEELVCHGTGSVIQVEVDDQLEEERLDSLEYVDEWNLISTEDALYLYIIAFTVPELSNEITESLDDLVGTCDPEIRDHAATISLVGSQDAIAGTIEKYEVEGISPNLRRLGGYHGGKQPLDRLSDRQREVIQTAFDMGYYEVPRNVSTEDISAELGLDSSTVAEHLQRAERNLLTVHLSQDTV